MPDVIIISTGAELLDGTTVNTNCSHISLLFFGSNFNVIKHITVGDDIMQISESISRSVNEADLVITTGGLGPTDDDNTVEAVCRATGRKAVKDRESDTKIINYFESMNFNHSILDSKMSTVPENSHVFQNTGGLAPGFSVNFKNKTIISLPGVPAEVVKMMDQSVMPYLKQQYTFSDGKNLTYRMSGIRESDINTTVNSIGLPEFLKIGITSKSGVCDLCIAGLTEELIRNEDIDLSIRKNFSRYILDYNSGSPEEELVKLLKIKGLTISTAESCTGGLLSKRITDIPGSSEVYKGSIIAYSNDVKISFLDVSEDTLRQYGAVSEKTALDMAVTVKKKFNTDISVSTTGIAGPGGGTEEKPAGTVCFGFTVRDYIHTTTRIIKGDRDRVRMFSSLYAINFLRDYLKNTNYM